MFEVEPIDAANRFTNFGGYGFGLFSDLAYIQDKASVENGRQVDLIKDMNNEL
jgi:hypothetical protein